MFSFLRGRKRTDVPLLRTWACVVGGTTAEVVRRLGLVPSRECELADGIADVAARDGRFFVVEHAASVFVFARDIGFSSLHETLSADGGVAYVVFCDAKRDNILCALARDGRQVRQLGYNGSDGGAFADGDPTPGEPELGDDGVLDEDAVMKLAKGWGPDPRDLQVARPRGTLFTQP